MNSNPIITVKVWRLTLKIDYGDFLAPCARASCFELLKYFKQLKTQLATITRWYF